MNTAIVIALIALAGSIGSAALSVFGAPAIQARRDAREVLSNYREPLLAASYELQARLYNILHLAFVEKYLKGESPVKKTAAVDSTLYVFAQFFGWREIIRREVQFLRFSSNDQTRQIGRLLGEISEVFLSDEYGPQFMIWRVEQRGFGECMIDSAGRKLTCIGYAAFIKRISEMPEWLDPLRYGLEHLSDDGRRRLTKLQNLLVDLVVKLDDGRQRSPPSSERAEPGAQPARRTGPVGEAASRWSPQPGGSGAGSLRIWLMI